MAASAAPEATEPKKFLRLRAAGLGGSILGVFIGFSPTHNRASFSGIQARGVGRVVGRVAESGEAVAKRLQDAILPHQWSCHS